MRERHVSGESGIPVWFAVQSLRLDDRLYESRKAIFDAEGEAL